MTRKSQPAARRDRRFRRAAGVWLAMVGMLVSACSTDAARSEPGAIAGPRTIRIDLLDFRFDPAVLDVQHGEAIRFVAVNRTELPHELFIASSAGQEAHHVLHAGAAPGSQGALEDGSTGIYVPARGTAQFTYRFDAPGEVQMGCHLVGHWEAGMVGLVRVGTG